MAVVRDPFGARQASGSVGGITAGRSAAGWIERAKGFCVDPRTIAQTQHRLRVQHLSREYQDLTEGQIDEWVDFARLWTVPGKLGYKIHITGLNWYVRLNIWLNRLVQPSIGTPPVNPNCDYNPWMEVTQDLTSGGNIDLDYNPSPVGNERIWYAYSPNMPKSSRSPKMRVLTTWDIDSTDSSPYELVPYAELSHGDSLVQVFAWAVDSVGRAGARRLWLIYPVSIS